MDYNQLQDNPFQPAQKRNMFAFTGKTLLQEQKEQLIFQEEKKKLDKQKELEFERKKVKQEEVVYLQRPDRKEPNGSQRKEILKQMDQEAEKNGDGGFFAKVFQQRDAKQSQRQQQQQAYAEEIRLQIEYKQKKKDEELKRQQDEDLKYENQVKQDLELLKDRFNKEEEKKQKVITTIKTKHHIQDQSKLVLNEFEDPQLNFTNQNIVPDYLKDPIIKETDEKYLRNQEIDQYQNRNTYTPRNKLYSQKSLDQQQQYYQQQQYQQQQNQQQQYEQQQQQYYQQSQNPINISYHMEQQQIYRQPEYKPIVPMLIEKYSREHEELKYINKMKNREQEEGLDRLKQELEMQSNLWNDELRRLRLDVQVSQEGKNKAYYELENLKDQLRRQEQYEENQLYQTKQELGLRNNTRYSGSRQFGIPSRTENRIMQEINLES